MILECSFRPKLADNLEAVLKRAGQEPSVVILKMQKLRALDARGMTAIERIYEQLQKRAIHLIVSDPHTQPLLTMQINGFIDKLGEENLCAPLEAALDRARQILAQKPAIKG